MKFDLHARKVAPDVTANVVLTVLLAVIDRRVTALPAIVRHVKVKGDLPAKAEVHVKVRDGLPAKAEVHVKVRDGLPAKAEVHVKVKGDLLADADRDAAKDLRADLKAVRWDHRVLNASWKMRCGLMPTPMESSAKKS
jgi:hypothetical protein